MKAVCFNFSYKHFAAVICALAVIRVLFTCIYVTWGSPAAVFICDLSACAMLDLYFRLVFLASGENKRLIFGITDTAALVLKVLFLFLPCLSYGGSAYIHIIAIAVDIGLSRFYAIYGLK